MKLKGTVNRPRHLRNPSGSSSSESDTNDSQSDSQVRESEKKKNQAEDWSKSREVAVTGVVRKENEDRESKIKDQKVSEREKHTEVKRTTQ